MIEEKESNIINYNQEINHNNHENKFNNSENSTEKQNESSKFIDSSKKNRQVDDCYYFKLISIQQQNSAEDIDNNSSNEKESEIEFLVKQKTCIIGRSLYSYRNNHVQAKIEKDVFHIKIDSSRFISRRHFKIFWNQGAWKIKNLSKISIYVGNIKLNKLDPPIILSDITPISSLAFRFYFVLPLKS